jgi:hypothetical protein
LGLIALKLVLVPLFLAALSLAGRRWGPRVAGWLAGLPLVTGPILYFVALERGADFAAQSARATLAAVFAMLAFNLAYAWGASRMRWPLAFPVALSGWLAAAFAVSAAPESLAFSTAVAVAALVLAPRLFPAVRGAGAPYAPPAYELLLRMAAGALFVLAVTASAAALGPAWTGRLSTIPILGLVLAIFTHRASGAASAAALLRAMARGLYSYATFCLVVAAALPRLGLAASFTLAIALGLVAQAASVAILQGSSAARRK